MTEKNILLDEQLDKVSGGEAGQKYLYNIGDLWIYESHGNVKLVATVIGILPDADNQHMYMVRFMRQENLQNETIDHQQMSEQAITEAISHADGKMI